MVLRDGASPASDVARFLHLMVWRAVRPRILLGRRRVVSKAAGRHRKSSARTRTCFAVVRFCDCARSGLVLLPPADHGFGDFRDSFCGRDLSLLLADWKSRRFPSDWATSRPETQGSEKWLTCLDCSRRGRLLDHLLHPGD